MFKVGVFAFLVGMANSTIVSDSGFNCATSKNNITTPLASATTLLGCGPKADWNGGLSTWCLTNGSAGSYQTGFGYTDTCAIAEIIPSLPINSLYTGQLLNVSWTTQNIVAPEIISFSYGGKTLGSSPVTTGFFQTTLAGNALQITNGSLTISTTNPLVQANITGFSVGTSKIVSIWLFTPAGPIVSGSTVPCGQNFTIIWSSVGMASVGSATITIASSFGGGGGGGSTIGTAVTGVLVNATGNNTISYSCPASYVPPGFGNSYTTTVTVGAYTLKSFTFSLAAAPSATPSNSPTPSQTPTASLSFGSTPSNTGTPSPSLPSSPSRSLTSSITSSATVTPSVTATVSFSGSPSITPSNSGTPTPTPTPRTIIDGSAILAAQSTQNTVMAASITGAILALVLIVFVSYRLYERKQLHERRVRRLRTATGTNIQSQRQIYIQTETLNQPNFRMYQTHVPGRNSRRNLS
jgi:hypothetical protein